MNAHIVDEADFRVIALVHSVIGIDVDPADVMARIETCETYRRNLLSLVYQPIFDGLHNGKFDAIAESRVQAAQDVCRVVEARIAAEAAIRDSLQ